MALAAPGLLITTRGCGKCLRAASAKARAITSVPPPAEAATTSSTGRAGALEVRGVFQAGGGNAGRQSKRCVISRGQCGFVVFDADDAGHRAKDFLAADAHGGRAFAEQRWRHEVALGSAAGVALDA